LTLALKDAALRVGADVHIHPTSLQLEQRGFNTLLGETLAGKTTLLRLMAGLVKPSAGQVWFGGRDVTGVPVQQRRVSMVYQQFINYPNLSVFDNIASPLRVVGTSAAEIQARVGRIAELLRLSPLLDRRPAELSGGQQQRCALARALVKDADLVLLDEPLANLDYKLREELREELPKIFAAAGSIFVYATAEPAEALLLGGNTATLSEGRVTQFGPTVEVYRRPNTLLTARTFSDPPLNAIAVEKRGAGLLLPDGSAWPAAGALGRLADQRYTLGFRPNHVFLRRPAPGAIALQAQVAVTEITGSESFVHLDYAGQRWVALAHGVHELATGATTEVFLDPARFFVFDSAGGLIAAPAAAGS
jgi:glycerol transport system ATP-binding protein